MTGAPPRTCSYCGDAPCEWDQYGEDIIGSRLRMLTSRRRWRSPSHMKKALAQLYYYKRNGSLYKTKRIEIPLCVEKKIAHLNSTIRYDLFKVCLLVWKLKLIQVCNCFVLLQTCVRDGTTGGSSANSVESGANGE